jgi:serine/threonine protein kinase
MFLKDEILEHVRAVADEPDLSGTKYRMIGALGRGGMGSVYGVEDVELGREVALKVSALAHDPRLSREARVIAQLEHPGIVPVHDSGVLPDGRVYYVMKRVRGERLDHWAATRDQREKLRLFCRVCEAVAFAHAHGVLHRDLKPENVMIGAFGEALVMDWGIATSDDATAPPEAAGTPAYMAPEQTHVGPGTLDRRADVYALGSILYFLLAGKPPYEGASAREILERKLSSAPPPLLGQPRPLISIVDKAIARDPADRYASALELSEDVGAFLDALPVRAHRESFAERIIRFASRHQVVLSLFAAYLLVRMLIALAR